MQTISVEQAENRLGRIIDSIAPGSEVVLTRDNRPVARIVVDRVEKPSPVFGRGKGMATVVSEDDSYLDDFAGYMS